MRFMIMHKNNPQTEAGHLPPMELVSKMGAFIGEHAKAGRLVDGAGLGASKTRTRLTFRDGSPTVKHGPYRGERELPAAMLLLKVRTREEAIGWAERYGKILGDGELELGKVNEPWDIGLMPPPENPPLQILLIEKADQTTEAGGRSPKQKSELTRLKTEMTKAGVLVALAPAAAKRRGQAPGVHQQRSAGARWAVHGDEGADRRLRGDGAVGDGRGDRAVPALRGDPGRDAGDRRPPRRPGRRGVVIVPIRSSEPREVLRRATFRRRTHPPHALSETTKPSVADRGLILVQRARMMASPPVAFPSRSRSLTRRSIRWSTAVHLVPALQPTCLHVRAVRDGRTGGDGPGDIARLATATRAFEEMVKPSAHSGHAARPGCKSCCTRSPPRRSGARHARNERPRRPKAGAVVPLQRDPVALIEKK